MTTLRGRTHKGDTAMGARSDVAEAEADYYAQLGLQPSADGEAIHRAYRALAKLWHPDRFVLAPEPLRARAERRMRTLTRAYAVLGDPVQRHQYDQRRGQHAPLATVQRAAAPTTPAPHAAATTQSGAANGAGILAGTICLILALALLGGTLRSEAGAGSALPLAAMFALFLLAGIFFTHDSTLSRAATRWMAYEPRAGGHTGEPTAPMPTAFERLVDDALADVPAEFAAWLANVAVQVRREPTRQMLREMGSRPGETLFGLYSGVPLTAPGADLAGPGVIYIFQGPLERACAGDPVVMREQVRRTVLHEIAHHFGIDHDEMPHWVR